MKTICLIALSLLLGSVTAGGLWAQDAETKLTTGDAAPAFQATALDGSEISLDTFRDADALLVVFTCNACPVAVAYEDRLVALAKQFSGEHFTMVAINNHRDETLEAMAERAKEKGFNFTYAYEGSGDSARAYGAKVTPHCFVFDKERQLVYQGAFDNSQKEPTEHYVADAVQAALAGKTVDVSHHKAFGCGIKLRQQNP